jgi:signal transduction histidine kinase
VAAGVGGGGGRSDDDSGGSAGQGQQDGLGQELGADLAAGGAQRPAVGLSSLVANLVDKAVRYNLPAGDIWISTRATAGGSQLTVANTGPVISPADAGRIFQPFERLSDRTSHDGSGLGLAIVASIAAIHGGTATAHARDDGGLAVTVTIPSAARGAP